MYATLRRKLQGRDLVAKLDEAIESLNLANEIPVIKAIILTVHEILILIKVGFPSAYAGWPLANLNRIS